MYIIFVDSFVFFVIYLVIAAVALRYIYMAIPFVGLFLLINTIVKTRRVKKNNDISNWGTVVFAICDVLRALIPGVYAVSLIYYESSPLSFVMNGIIPTLVMIIAYSYFSNKCVENPERSLTITMIMYFLLGWVLTLTSMMLFEQLTNPQSTKIVEDILESLFLSASQIVYILPVAIGRFISPVMILAVIANPVFIILFIIKAIEIAYRLIMDK